MRAPRRAARRALSGGARRAEAPARRARFYEAVGVEGVDGGWAVCVDGRRVATPAGGALALPTESLALALAAEWDAQAPSVVPAAMPLTSLAFTAVDQIAGGAGACAAGLLGYAATDTCRFFADGLAEPGVRAAQDAAHRPLLDWLRRERGVVLEPAEPAAFRAPPLDAASADAARAYCGALTHWELSALQCAVFEAKSSASRRRLREEVVARGPSGEAFL
jgi:chaperone required for assembly of F1-ATPase